VEAKTSSENEWKRKCVREIWSEVATSRGGNAELVRLGAVGGKLGRGGGNKPPRKGESARQKINSDLRRRGIAAEVQETLASMMARVRNAAAIRGRGGDKEKGIGDLLGMSEIRP